MSKAFSSEWYEQYENRRQTSRAFPQPIVCHEPMAAKEREISHTKRLHVSVTSYRKRLCDADNLCPKYFIDCLRYCEAIKDDSAKHITLEVNQVKVNHYEDECTAIEITNHTMI